jgi:5-methylcytosine-specific restriction endonuclease McrA
MRYVFDPVKTHIARSIPEVIGQMLMMAESVNKQLKYSGPLWQELARQVKIRDGWRCTKCGSSKMLDVHHIVPIKAGGSNMLYNLKTLCRRCHRLRTFGGKKPSGNPWAERGLK